MTEMLIEAQSQEEAALVQRINTGKHTQADINALRKVMREKPGQLSKAADLCAVAFQNAIRLVSPEDTLFAELIADRREVLRTELGYAEVLPVEKLLIDEIVLCWFRHYQAELKYTEVQEGTTTFAQGGYWEKKLGATQRRYLRSIETMVRVRKLLGGSMIQINVATDGGRQIVANSGLQAGGAS